MPVIDRIKDFQNDLVAIRRDIHAHPEIGFEETRTSAIVADLLETWGITAYICSEHYRAYLAIAHRRESRRA